MHCDDPIIACTYMYMHICDKVTDNIISVGVLTVYNYAFRRERIFVLVFPILPSGLSHGVFNFEDDVLICIVRQVAHEPVPGYSVSCAACRVQASSCTPIVTQASPGST